MTGTILPPNGGQDIVQGSGQETDRKMVILYLRIRSKKSPIYREDTHQKSKKGLQKEGNTFAHRLTPICISMS